MRKRNFKGRCEKRKVAKCNGICKTYDPIQYAYVDVLVERDDIKEIMCNVDIEDSEWGEYMSDILCTKRDGTLMVRECVNRKLIEKPLTMKILEASRRYWLSKGVEDWGIVINENIDEERE